MRSFAAGVACQCRGPENIFCEQPDQVRVVRDLSTVEELELTLAMSSMRSTCLMRRNTSPTDQIAPLMEAHGKQLRATFIAKHGYRPEDSTTPYVPVTIDGPQDHDPIMPKNIRNRQRSKEWYTWGKERGSTRY